MAKSIKKYMGNGDVRNAIRRRGKQMAAELKDEEIWLSAEFRNYARRLADFILRKHKLYKLDICYDTSECASVAYTDGKDIVLNAGNVLAQHPKLLEGRFKVNMGVLFHETAHKLFLDFNIHKKGIDQLLSGNLWGNFDPPAGSDLEANYEELKQAMQDGYKKSILSVYREVLNIINDGHDEAVMKKCFPGFIAQCITAAGDVQMELSTPLEQNVANGVPALSIMYSIILQYAKFGYVNRGEDTDETQPYTELLSRMEPVIDEALEEDDYMKRWNIINSLVLMLWPLIRNVLKNKSSSSSGFSSCSDSSSNSSGGSSGGGGCFDGLVDSNDTDSNDSPLSDDEAEEILQSLAAAAQADNNVAQAPTGTGSAVSSQVVSAGVGGISPDGDSDFAGMLEALGQDKATQAVQNEIDQSQLDAIRNVKRPFIHRNVDVEIERHHEEDKDAYMQMYRDVEPFVRNLISEITALLREYNEEAIQHHKRFGPIVEATEAYRPDGAFFAKKRMPEDRPNMAMCILLDESGSMGGSKIKTAKKAMIMLERFASGVGVPLMVAGHYAGHGDVCLNIYTDYVSARTEHDRYTLASIESHGCNRDGLPLRVCADLLAQRPEDIRLMVVISDGAPNDTGYGGEAAFDDIKKTVVEFRRKGLLIYGAAIDDDREIIQDLYGSGFLSITDLKSLPKTMVRLLRQNIV